MTTKEQLTAKELDRLASAILVAHNAGASHYWIAQARIAMNSGQVDKAQRCLKTAKATI